MYDKKDVQSAYEAFGLGVPDKLPTFADETEVQRNGVSFERTRDGAGELFAGDGNELSEIREDDTAETAETALTEDEPVDDEGLRREQTHEERTAHKAARIAGRDDLHGVINAQMAATEARLRAEHERQLDAMVAAMGQTDPETGAQLRTRAEMEASRYRAEQRQLTEKLNSGTASAEDIDRVVGAAVTNHPDMQVAKAAAEAQRQAQMVQFAQRIEAEAQGLAVFDATLTGMSSVRSLERFPQMAALIEQGATLTQAYTAVYADAVERRRIDAAVAADRQKREGKGHLTSSRGTGRGGAADIPQNRIDAFRQFSAFENLTNEEIRKQILAMNLPD